MKIEEAGKLPKIGTKETLKQIYITVATSSSLTILANKVARQLQPNENIFDVCSKLANDIAKENGLSWSNVLMQYYLDYNKEALPQFDNWRIPAKPKMKSTRELALEWWYGLSSLRKTQLCDTNTELLGSVRRWETLTGREIEEIWLKETQG